MNTHKNPKLIEYITYRNSTDIYILKVLHDYETLFILIRFSVKWKETDP